MPDPEIKGNILTRVLGIEAYKQAVADESSIDWRKSDLSRARIHGGLSAIIHAAIPLSETILRGDPNVTNRRFYLSGGADLAANAIAYFLAGYLNAPVGLGFKVAYNLGVEVAREIPDVLRSIRERFNPSV